MKQIRLRGKNGEGKFALVDDEDYEWLSRFNWCCTTSHGKTYAIRQVGTNQKSKHQSMHRQIMGNPGNPRGKTVDHINGNSLDYRRQNLRVCTNQQNVTNAKRRTDNTSGYKGVCWSKKHSKWKVQLSVDKKNTHLGLFKKLEHAALAYDLWAVDIYGAFAKTNHPVVKHSSLSSSL